LVTYWPGESGSALARELAVKRTILYRWREAFRAGGALALRPKRGRPPKSARAIKSGLQDVRNGSIFGRFGQDAGPLFQS